MLRSIAVASLTILVLSTSNPSAAQQAALWSNGGKTFLPSPFNQSIAYDINNAGTVVGAVLKND